MKSLSSPAAAVNDRGATLPVRCDAPHGVSGPSSARKPSRSPRCGCGEKLLKDAAGHLACPNCTGWTPATSAPGGTAGASPEAPRTPGNNEAAYLAASDSAASAKLLEIERLLSRAAELAGEWADEHGEGCGCSYCRWHGLSAAAAEVLADIVRHAAGAQWSANAAASLLGGAMGEFGLDSAGGES